MQAPGCHEGWPPISVPSAQVEVVTGEEGEEVLYSHRSKLYRFDGATGEWKERGLGDIKLLENRRTAKIRCVLPLLAVVSGHCPGVMASVSWL